MGSRIVIRRGRARARRVIGIAALVGVAFAASAATPARTRDPLQALSSRLLANGRGEAVLELRSPDFTGVAKTVRGRLALEPPDRASLEFEETGERVTMRGDGGEWLQPALAQMMVLRSSHAIGASRWWQAFLSNTPGAIRSHRLGGNRWLLVRPQSIDAAAESAWVEVDARGLPTRIELRDAGVASSVYRLSAWRFVKARGRDAFVVKPPPGTTVVPLP